MLRGPAEAGRDMWNDRRAQVTVYLIFINSCSDVNKTRPNASATLTGHIASLHLFFYPAYKSIQDHKMSSPAFDTIHDQTEGQDLHQEVQTQEHLPVEPTPEVQEEPGSDHQDNEEQPEAEVLEQEQEQIAEQERMQDQEDQIQGAELVSQQPTAEEQEETRDELYNEVFGNQGSDASDLSDDEDMRMDEGEKYVPATATNAAKIPKFKKSKRDDEDEDEDEDDEDDGEERRRKKKKKAERRRKREEEEEEEEEDEAPVLDEATRKLHLSLKSRLYRL